MEIRNLKTFQLAAKYLNFTTVAIELNYSQPTITSQIKLLEQELGQPLFTHIGKKTYLTPAGELLKNYADQILSLVDETEEAFRSFLQPCGQLYIAGYETFCTNIFPSVLSKYITFHNNVDIKLCSCSRSNAIKGILENKYDLGIISGSIDNPCVECIYLSEEKLLCVVSKELYSKYSTEELFTNYPLIEYRVDEHFSEMTDLYITRNQILQNKVFEFGSLPAIKKAILNHMGIGIITDSYIREEIKKGELIPLELNQSNISVYSSLIMLKSKSQWPNAIEFINILREIWPH